MKMKNYLVLCVAVLTYACARAVASPAAAAAQNMQNNIAAAGKFQAALQQQNLFTILTSIEDRLRNLDNIYSMQLAQTLEVKLDQYSRRLEVLDTKMIRLEALVMLNLDKISENISTKNFKDDMIKTNLLRKMDSVYEGISHRLGYMERKHDANLAKIQSKVDATFTRLEKIEENMMTRDSDIEAEISDAVFAIDDLKTTCTMMEEKMYNISTATLNVTKDSYKSMQGMNVDSRKSMNVLHDNIIETLKYMNNRTLRHFKVVEDNNIMLKTMKSELKEDFNDYANKVADMNSYIWKNRDTTGDDLNRLETIVNSTKTEVQNGVRSLMLQIGKISNKGNTVPSGENSLEGINKNLNTNFQRILTNQDLFLESCHRLQMDESQIESEISVMLEKLIDMLEKKMSSEMKDIKNLEKALKTHDSRVSRNMYQINNNVISLFEKSTVNNEALSTEVKKIGNDLDALFAFVQSTATSGSPSFSINTKALQDKLNKLENMISKISANETILYWNTTHGINFDNNSNEDIKKNISKSLSSIESLIYSALNEENFDKILSKITKKYLHNNCTEHKDIKMVTNDEINIDKDTKNLIYDIFGPNPDLQKSSQVVENVNTGKTKCKPNYHNLINIRTGLDNCEDTQERISKKKKKGKKVKKKRLHTLDVRGNFGPEESIEYEDSEENSETTTLENLEDLINEEYSTTETSTILNEDVYSSL